MSNTWFRMYNEFATDPKVQSMSEAMQRRLAMLFCFQSSGELEKLTHDELAFSLRVDSETLHETFQLFHDKGFCDENGHLLNWDKRQYKSDTSTLRVKKYREKTKVKQNETPMKRFSNGDVTAPDTDTDTERKKKDNPIGLSKKKISLEELSVDHIADWLAQKRSKGKYLDHDENFIIEYFKNYCQSKGKRYADVVAGLRNAFEWDSVQPQQNRQPAGKFTNGVKPPGATSTHLAGLSDALHRRRDSQRLRGMEPTAGGNPLGAAPASIKGGSGQVEIFPPERT